MRRSDRRRDVAFLACGALQRSANAWADDDAQDLQDEPKGGNAVA
jgi:hypothetical protein